VCCWVVACMFMHCTRAHSCINSAVTYFSSHEVCISCIRVFHHLFSIIVCYIFSIRWSVHIVYSCCPSSNFNYSVLHIYIIWSVHMMYSCFPSYIYKYSVCIDVQCIHMGWLRFAGSLKLEVSFLSQKSPIKETIFCERDL